MSSVKINAISRWSSYGVNALIMLLLTPFVIDKLGKPSFGIWRFGITFAGYFGFLNLAVSSSLTRYVARYAGCGDQESLNQTVSTAIAICLITASIAIVVPLVYGNEIVTFFQKTPPQLTKEFKELIWILGVATGIGLFSNVLGAIVTAHEYFVASSLSGIFVNLLKAILIVSFLLFGRGLVGVGWAVLITAAVRSLINYFICRKFTPDVEITITHARWDVLRELLVYGGTTTAIVLGDTLRTQIDNTVIGKMIGFGEVATYSIAGSLINQIVGFATAGVGVLTPRFANLEAKGHMTDIGRLLIRSLHYSSLLGIGLCLLVFVWGGDFIRLWVGPNFSRSIPVLWILSIAWVTDLSQSPGIGIMYALNKHRIYAGACLLEGILNLWFTLILVKRFGIFGVALGSAIPMVALRIFLQPIYVTRIVGISLQRYLTPVLIPLSSGLIVVAFFYLIGAFSRPIATSWLALGTYGFLTILAFSVISTVSSWLFGFQELPLLDVYFALRKLTRTQRIKSNV